MHDNGQNLPSGKQQQLDIDTSNQTTDNKPTKKQNVLLSKQTIKEFIRSIIVGIFPVILDLLASSIVFYLFFARANGITFGQLLFAKNLQIPHKITVIGTAVGYGVAAVLAYLLAIFFVFDNKKQGRTAKGIVLFIIIEGFAYGFNVLLGWLFNMFLPSIYAYVLRIAVSYVVIFSLRKVLIFSEKPQKKPKKE